VSEQIMNTKEACEYLGVSYWTLTNILIKEIPHIRHSSRGRIKFKKSTLDKYINEQEENSMKNLKQDLTPNKREMSITELREKYKQTIGYLAIEKAMKDAKKSW